MRIWKWVACVSMHVRKEILERVLALSYCTLQCSINALKGKNELTNETEDLVLPIAVTENNQVLASCTYWMACYNADNEYNNS